MKINKKFNENFKREPVFQIFELKIVKNLLKIIKNFIKILLKLNKKS